MTVTRTAALLIVVLNFLSCLLGSAEHHEERTSLGDEEGTSHSSRRFQSDFLQDWPAASREPHFDPSTPNNVTGLVGKSVVLVCKVKNLQNRTVSWVRHRDIHLLTVGRYTYTSDQRFEAQHLPRSEEWKLRIRSAQGRDSGLYECQISTTPPMGYLVNLTIVEPETAIVGGPDLFIDLGSTINLTCVVQHTPEPPTIISWTHGNEPINFDSARGGISLVTEKGSRSSSRLLVQRARGADAGRYACAPDNAPPATARVHVLDGEQPAAMHSRACGTGRDPTGRIVVCLLVISILHHICNRIHHQ